MAAKSHQVAAEEPSIPPVRSIRRALSLIETLPGENPKSAADLARESEMSLSTVIRLLRTLEDAGWVQRGADRRYELGRTALSFSQSLHAFGWMLSAADALVSRARDRVNETCGLHVPDGAERVCVAAAQSRNPVRHVVAVGSRAPIWLGAGGKVLLAVDDSEPLWSRISSNAGRYELQGGRTRPLSELREECERVRLNSRAFSSQEWTEDSIGIAVPVFLGGSFIGSLGAAIPALRATARSQEEIADALLEEARHLESLGKGIKAPSGTLQRLLEYSSFPTEP